MPIELKLQLEYWNQAVKLFNKPQMTLHDFQNMVNLCFSG